MRLVAAAHRKGGEAVRRSVQPGRSPGEPGEVALTAFLEGS